MSLQLDARVAKSGTRFRIFPLPRYAQAPAFSKPETITISVPAGSVLAGPEDDRMYVVDATHKQPYNNDGPPYLGPAGPKIQPGPGGHFDQVDPKSRDFLVCTMYATVRRVLDIWEDYFGRRIEWHFASQFERMELIPLINWDNAQSGYGFLEFGYGRRSNGGLDFKKPYCENFDVLAHELGHSIIFTEVGVPSSDAMATADYGGFHESAGDLTALVALLHFESVCTHLLATSHGNLFTVNELSRMGELSKSRQIRMAFNYLRMSDIGDEPHDRSEPLTGAFFDVFVEMYQRRLVAFGAITQALASASLGPRGQSQEADELQAQFNTAYAKSPQRFMLALHQARDEFGKLLAALWGNLSPDNLTYAGLVRTLLKQDAAHNAGANREAIRASFAWREIAVPANSGLRAIHRVMHEDYAGTAADLLNVVGRKVRDIKAKAPQPAKAKKYTPASVKT